MGLVGLGCNLQLLQVTAAAAVIDFVKNKRFSVVVVVVVVVVAVVVVVVVAVVVKPFFLPNDISGTPSVLPDSSS